MKHTPLNTFQWDGAFDGDDDAAVRSICVTGSHAAFLCAAGILLEYAQRFPDRTQEEEIDRPLYDVDRDVQRYLIAIGTQLLGLVPCGGEDPETMIQLRQNPSNLCQLQQSLDGGATWFLAYDFTLCEAIGGGSSLVTTNVNNFYQQATTIIQEYYNDYTANYTDDVTDLHPDLGYGDSDDDARNLALCQTLKDFIEICCQTALKQYDEFETTANNVKLAASLAAGVAALLGLATGGLASAPLAALAAEATLWAAGIALGTTLGEALYTTIINNNREFFEDEEAKKAVKCALYTLLKDANLNQDDFKAAIGSLTFEDSAGAISAYMDILMQEDATYATFTAKLDENFRAAKVDLILPCDCSTYTLYVVGILATPPGIIYERGFESGDIVTLEAYQDNEDHWHIPVKLPAGNWEVELIDFDPPISLPSAEYPYNSFESADAYHDTSGTFHNTTWNAGGDPQLFGTKEVTNNVFAPWGASQDWAFWMNAGEPFTIQVRLTLL